MAGNRGEKKDSIEDLKDSLYSRGNPPEIAPEIRTPLTSEIREHPPVGWQDIAIKNTHPNEPYIPMKNNGTSLTTKFFIGSVLFFMLATGGAAYLFFYGGNTISPQNIDIEIVAPSVIDGGKPSSFQILVDNRNQSPLQLVDLSIDYPQGARNPEDETQPLTHERQSIGSIAPGQQIERTSSAVFYGEEGSQQKILVTLQYSIPGSNSIFRKQSDVTFTLGSSPVSVSVSSPKEAIAGQVFAVEVTVTSNSTAPIDNVVLQGQYPFGFSVVSTSPKADTGGTIWRLGTLKPGDTKVLRLTGTIDGQDGDERVFRFVSGSIADQTDTQIKVPFIVMPQTLTVHRPFITATLALNGKTGKTVAISGQQTVTGVLTWQNNLSIPVSNLELRVALSGPTLDTSSVRSSNGFYQSQNTTLVWSKDEDSLLAQVPPGGTGTEQFSFSTLLPGSSGTVYTNPVINLNVSVSGVREGEVGVPENVSSAASIQANVVSAAQVAVQAFHFSGPFANSGPMPPKAEQPTTYSVVWNVRNPSNTVANATVAATLPTYVTFVGAKAGSGVQYDPGSRRVSWSLGDLKAGVGYSSPVLSAAFQISLTPSASQVGGTPELLNATQLSGEDRFAQVPVSASAPAVTTNLQGDTGFLPGMANVAPKQ